MVTLRRFFCAPLLLLCLVSCRKEEMQKDARYAPLDPSDFYADGLSARPLVAGTVTRDGSQAQGYEAQPLSQVEAPDFPADFPRSGEALRLKLLRGQERYDIYCALCHCAAGDGDGMVVRRGMTAPPSFHIDRLRQAPPGHFFATITYGHGAMYSYAARVEPDDRWAITAYIRALQLSQGALNQDLADADRAQLEKSAHE
jgi:mono/diheme cytochrome c family protein